MANRPQGLNLATLMSCRWCGATPRDLRRHHATCTKRPQKRTAPCGDGA